MATSVSDTQWSQLSELVAEKVGLHFPLERLADLQRGTAGAARELGFEDTGACVGWLLSGAPAAAYVEVLGSHLTVGETYFFRDSKTFDVLAGEILPELVRARRGREQRMRFWSAACCTGEEPYSLAILLHQVLPDLRDWHVTITATDINRRFLHKAAAGTYGEWSFRDAPAWLKARYFSRTGDGRYAVLPEIRKLVTFAQLNLAEDAYPSLVTDTNAMDVIFCRNALMYFTPLHAREVIRNLHHALIEGGWLAVSPSEASHVSHPQFAAVNFPGAILFRKSGAQLPAKHPRVPPLGDAPDLVAPAIEKAPSRAPPPSVAGQPRRAPGSAPEASAPAARLPAARAVAESLYREGRYAEAADALIASFSRHAPDAQAFSLVARALANQGELTNALAWCDRWIAADKLDPAAHYLRAVVLLERGDPEQAHASLQRALYLRPDFVLAHFAQGNLARGRGRFEAARRHFANALQLLGRYAPNEPLPESEGLSAARLTETILSMTEAQAAP